MTLHPSTQNRPTREVVGDELDAKYSNKVSAAQLRIETHLTRLLLSQVLPGVGLCICVYDIKSIGDAIIIPGDGNAYTEGEPG